jgi:formylglycine-generating enzyme required for sulfatase activity
MRWPSSRTAFGPLALTLAFGCQSGDSPSVSDKARAMEPDNLALNELAVPRAVPAEAAKTVKVEKGLEISVPAGVLRLGSPTGSADRDPAREADDVSVEVPAFQIDAYPHPNDPTAPVTTGVSRAEAAKLCAAGGKRLCSEVEWERACKGDANAAYPGSEPFDAARCAAEPARCATSFGVLAMGALGREWTRDDSSVGLGDTLRTAVVRGAARDALPRLHRCAARDGATADSKSDTLTFRCCRGDVPELSYPVQTLAKTPFEERALPDVREVLASMPETRELAGQFRLFTHDERTRSLQAAGYSRNGVQPWQVAEKPLRWSPVRGEEVSVLAGDTPRGAVLVLYYPLGEGKNLFAGSYETKGEHTAILLAYKVDVPGEVLFSSCWGCGGEGGALSLGEDSRVQIVQR